MLSGLSYLNFLGMSIFNRRSLCVVFFLLSCFSEILVLNANSVDLDQVAHSTLFVNGPFCGP